MPVAQSPAHYINSSKGCPSITESFLLCYFFVLCATVTALPVVEPHCYIVFALSAKQFVFLLFSAFASFSFC
jgi:hypothetical protein